VRRWRISRIEGIFRRINRLLPTFQQSVAQHPLDHRPRHLRQLQKLWQRQWPALRLQQFTHPFFSALPLRAAFTPILSGRLCVILFLFLFLFLFPFLFLFLFFFLRQFLSRQRAALPRDHSLRPAVSFLHGLPNFNEPAAL